MSVSHLKFDYGHHRGRDWTYYAGYIPRLRGDPSPLLELGSGIGLFLEACAHNGIEAVGLEYEAEGVAEATAKGLTAYQHDLANPMPFENESFASVFSNQVIEHVTADAQEMMVREAYRVLRPGGQLHIISPCRHWEPARLDKYHITLLTPHELKALCERHGFVNSVMAYNRMQEIPGVPKDLLEPIWRKYMPDLLSQDACILTFKPIPA